MNSFNISKARLLLLFVITYFSFTACGVNGTIVGNVNTNQTVVELSESNYEILGRYQGTSTARYIIGMGGLAEKDMHDKAMRELLEKANLKGSQALVNVTTERHYEWKFLIMKSNVIVSAHVIEFK